MSRLILVLLVVCLLPAAHAAERGFEFGAGIGISLIRDTDNGETFQGNGTAYELTVGYRFSPRFVATMGYLDLGEADDTIGGVDTTIDVNALAFGLRYTFNPDSTAEWYARLGGVHYFSDVDPGGVGLEDIFGSGAIEVGAGVEFAARENGAFYLEARYLDGDDQEEGGAALLGYRFRF